MAAPEAPRSVDGAVLRYLAVGGVIAVVAVFGLARPAASPIADGLWRAGLAAAMFAAIGTQSMRRIFLASLGAIALGLLDGLVAVPVWFIVVGAALWVTRPPRWAIAAGLTAAFVATAAGVAGLVAGLDAVDEMTVARGEMSNLAVGDLDDFDRLEPSIAAIEGHVARADTRLGSFGATSARYLPVIGAHLAAAQTVIDGAADVVDSAKPLQSIDLADFGREGGLASDQLLESSVQVAAVAAAAEQAQTALADIDRGWLMPWLIDNIDEAETVIGDGAAEADRLGRLLKGVRRQTGGEAPVRWFVLLCSPVEARASCGFPGNYMELEFIDGRLEVVASGRVRELEQRAKELGVELKFDSDYRNRYERFGVAQTIRNVTVSPHWPDIAQALQQIYGDLTGRSVNVVAGVNTQGLAALLQMTGPVEMEGLGVITAGNVRQKLEIDQYAQLGRDPERVDALADLTDAIVDRLEAGVAVDAEAIRTLSEAAERGGVALFAFDDPERLARDGGVAGELPAVPIGVTWQNAAGNKLDAYADTKMRYRSPTSETAGCVIFDQTNNGPDGLPAIAAGYGTIVPPNWQRSLISVYSPTPVVALTVSGERRDFSSEREHGAWVGWLYVDIAPGETVTVAAELAAGADEAATLRLQPSSRPTQVATDVAEPCIDR